MEQSGLAMTLRGSRYGYALVNTGHVLGIALLVGAMVPLDLRLMGVWPRTARAALLRVLLPVAMAGMMLALVTGALLFTVRASEYAAVGALQAKLVLVLIAIGSALALHLKHGPWLESASRSRLAAAGAVSACCWTGALVLGRMIAFSAS